MTTTTKTDDTMVGATRSEVLEFLMDQDLTEADANDMIDAFLEGGDITMTIGAACWEYAADIAAAKK